MKVPYQMNETIKCEDTSVEILKAKSLAAKAEAMKAFVRTVDELGELLEVPRPSVTFGAVDYRKNRLYTKSVAVHIFIEFRKLRRDAQSYKSIIKQLKKSNLSDEKKQWLTKINDYADGIDAFNYASCQFGDELRNLSNIDAFYELESTYITHTDRDNSPIKKHFPDDTPDEFAQYTYLIQVLEMVKAYYEYFLYHLKEFCVEIIADNVEDKNIVALEQAEMLYGSSQ